MTNRRAFLQKSLLSLTGYSLISELKASDPDTLEKVGIITNTVRNELATDYRQTFKTLADIGYKCLESGFVPEGTDPKEFNRYLKALGLSTVITGIGMNDLVKGNLDETLRKAEGLGVQYITCYWPWQSNAQNLTETEVMEAAERINRFGKQLRESGFRFAWHNHDKEFAKINDEYVFDILLENTDPAYSTVQMDWYWVVKGGEDPIRYFKKYPGRFELAHVKDMNNNTDGGISCVGQGIIDFKPIFDQAKTGGARYYIVENERAVDGFKCARSSFQHLTQILK